MCRTVTDHKRLEVDSWDEAVLVLSASELLGLDQTVSLRSAAHVCLHKVHPSS